MAIAWWPNIVLKTNIDALAIVIYDDNFESDSDVNIDKVDDHEWIGEDNCKQKHLWNEDW